jgi:hypothetical protein
MLDPVAPPVLPPDATASQRMEVDGESMTDGFGEAPSDMRTLGGSVDFFSSLGTEVKKKPKQERPNPDKV